MSDKKTPFIDGPMLKFVKTATLPAITERMDPIDLLLNSSWIYASDRFKELVLPALQPISSAPEAKIIISSFVNGGSDLQRQQVIPDARPFEWHHFYRLLNEQQSGGGGILLSNGYVNVCDMEINDNKIVVSMSFGTNPRPKNSTTQQWCLYANYFGCRHYDGGRQVLTLLQ